MKRPISVLTAKYDNEELFQLDSHRENPYIRAFPREIPEAKLWELMYSPVRFNQDISMLSIEERITLSKRIRHCVIPTKVFCEFYQKVHSLILSGYENRNPLDKNVVEWNYDIALNKQPTKCTTSEVLFLTGISGLGKSTLVQCIERFFPQVIKHNFKQKDGVIFSRTQLVYLYVNMPPDASRAAFCKSILRELDRVINSRYMRDITTRTTIDEMESMILTAFATHDLGLLIIDEFQNLKVAKSGGDEVLMNFMARICNESDTPILNVGTTDAFKIFRRLFAKSRRMTSGGEIELLIFNKDSKDWNVLIEEAFSMQFVKNPVVLTASFKDEIFKLCHGVPYCLFRLITLMNIDAIRSGAERFTIEQMRRVYQTQFRFLKGALRALKNGNTGIYADLMSITQMLDEGNTKKGVNDLIRLAKSQNFTGEAAHQLAVDIEETIENYDLSQKEIEQLDSLKRGLLARSAQFSSHPQVLVGKLE